MLSLMRTERSRLHAREPLRGPDRACFARAVRLEVLIAVLQRHLSRRGTQSTDAQQVVSRGGQAHQLGVARDALQPRLARAAAGLAPAEELLDALAHDLTGAISARPEHAAAQANVASLNVSDVWGRALLQQSGYEPPRVVALVGADTLEAQALAPLPGNQCERSVGLGDTDRGSDSDIGHQAVAVVHQRVTGKAQLRLFARTLAFELGLRIGSALVRIVAPSFALEVAVPAAIGSRTATIL